MLRISHTPLFMAITPILIAILSYGPTSASAHTGSPKWFVREGSGKDERELGSFERLPLKPVFATTALNVYYLYKEKYVLVDQCKQSLLHEVVLTGGTPGKAEIAELVLGECSESISSPCTVTSRTEEFKAVSLVGELVYSNSGSKVDMLILRTTSPFIKMKVTCEGERLEFSLYGAVLAEVPAFAYSTETDLQFSPLIDEYETSSGEAKHAELEIPLLGGLAFLENTVLFNLEGSSSMKEVKAA